MSSSVTLVSSLFLVVYQLAFSRGKGWQRKRSMARRPQGTATKEVSFSDKVPIAMISTSDMALQVILFSDGEEQALLGCMSPHLLQGETNKT